MTASIDEIEKALDTLDEPSPWGPDIEASDNFLDRVFKDFYKKLQLPNLMSETDYHRPADHVPRHAIDGEIAEKLDAICEVATRACPRNKWI
jgi:hypothetical protein